MDEEVLQAAPSEPAYELRPPVAIKVVALVFCIVLGVVSLMFLSLTLSTDQELGWIFFAVSVALDALFVVLYLIAKRQRLKLEQGVFSYTNGLSAVKYANASDVARVDVKMLLWGMLGCKVVFYGAQDEVSLSFSDDVGTIFRGRIFVASLAYYGIPLYYN